MRLALLRVAAIATLLAGPALGRELAEAPHAQPIGISEDGRHFAYEQYLDDALSGTVLASIDVLDRETGRSAEGFPLGYLGMTKGGTYPAKAGDHTVVVDESLPEAERLDALRRRLRDAAAPRLEALGIRWRLLRLAGSPLTDRSRRPGTIDFALGAYVPGAVPDLQPVYRLAARIAPADAQACIGTKAKPQDHTVEIEVTRPAGRGTKATARASASIPWSRGDEECAQAAIVTDVLVAERSPAEGPSHAIVLVLAVSWAPHAEAARYLAAFVPLP